MGIVSDPREGTTFVNVQTEDMVGGMKGYFLYMSKEKVCPHFDFLAELAGALGMSGDEIRDPYFCYVDVSPEESDHNQFRSPMTMKIEAHRFCVGSLLPYLEEHWQSILSTPRLRGMVRKLFIEIWGLDDDRVNQIFSDESKEALVYAGMDAMFLRSGCPQAPKHGRDGRI